MTIVARVFVYFLHAGLFTSRMRVCLFSRTRVCLFQVTRVVYTSWDIWFYFSLYFNGSDKMAVDVLLHYDPGRPGVPNIPSISVATGTPVFG